MIQKTLFLLAIIVVFASCTSDNDEPKTEFEIAKAKWKKFQYDDYNIQENISCFCMGILEWRTKVTNNEKEAVYFEGSELVDKEEYKAIFDKAKTIEDAFNFIESFDKKKVFSLEVVYDEQFGFPKSIVIDYEENLADDEIAYFYSNFTPTK